MATFDESLLDDPARADEAGSGLRRLATSGARLRMADVTGARLAFAETMRPRAILAVGTQSRLMRAVMEPTCPVPLIAWPLPDLPTWVGPLDLVVVIADMDDRLSPLVNQCVRRGAQLVVVAPVGSAVVESTPTMSIVTVSEEDSFTQVLVALHGLGMVGLGPSVDVDQVADALDDVADICGPKRDLGENPAKDLACALADTVPLMCGRSVLAARAARRIAEAVSAATFAPALASDDAALAPLIAGAHPQDLFIDPFEDAGSPLRFSVLLLDDGTSALQGVDLEALAESRGIHPRTIRCLEGGPVERYSVILHHGLFAGEYLKLASDVGQ